MGINKMKIIDFIKLDIDEKRIYGLDLLRALAILFVVFEHSVSILPHEIFTFINYFYVDGVVIFFVLSGFLIGGILIKSVEKRGFNKSELLIFWIRRWFRTLPNYYLFVILLTILSKLLIIGFPLKMVPPYFIFSQNLFNGIDRSFFGESWSLCVEEWFYLTIPLIVFISVNYLKFSFRQTLITISIIIIAFTILLKYYLYQADIIPKMQDYSRVVIIRIDNIMYGILGAYLCYYKKEYWLKFKFHFFYAGMALLLVWKVFYFLYPSINGFYRVNLFHPILCTAILFMLPILNEYKVKQHSKITIFITYISLISYSLYLIHNSFIRKLIIENLLFNSTTDISTFTIITKNLFYWSASLMGALLIYKYFEIPTTKLRDKFNFKKIK